MSEPAGGGLTFWEHLDELRSALVHSLLAVAIGAVAVFCLKDVLFDVVLAPRNSDFVTFRLLGTPPFALHLMNTGLTEQFMTHVRLSFFAGLLVSSPYVLWRLFLFVSPGLYRHERRLAVTVLLAAYVMFLTGLLANYFMVFPLAVRFLGTYQVNADVTNMLTLESYTDTLISLSLVMGLLFELPVVCALLGRLGLLSGSLMRRYRRHAVVAILIVAAVVTPTTDVTTLLVVSLPIWLLYELSIFIVAVVRR